jgi:hypothetical protein
MKEFEFIQECLNRAQEEILAHYMAKKEHPLWDSGHKGKALRALQMAHDSILKIKKEL